MVRRRVPRAREYEETQKKARQRENDEFEGENQSRTAY